MNIISPTKLSLIFFLTNAVKNTVSLLTIPKQFICTSCTSCFLSLHSSYPYQNLNSHNDQNLFKDGIHCFIHQINSSKFLEYNLGKWPLRQFFFWNVLTKPQTNIKNKSLQQNFGNQTNIIRNL